MDCQSPNIGWAGLVATESANLMSKPGVMDKQPPGKRLSGAEKNENHEKWKPPDALQWCRRQAIVLRPVLSKNASAAVFFVVPVQPCFHALYF